MANLTLQGNPGEKRPVGRDIRLQNIYAILPINFDTL